jgi:hypothetical protein
MKKLVIVILVIIFLNNCKHPPRSAPNATTPGGSVNQASPPDSTGPQVDTSATIVDTTSIASPSADQEKRYSILGYSYFKSMRQNETRNINAYVTVVNPATKVIDTLRQINNEVLPERQNDTASIFTQNIILYKYLDITLIDPGSDFVIKQVHDSARQKIDSVDGNLWSWAITPKTNKREARLILRVVAEKPDGSREPFQAKNIPININLDRGIFRAIYIWLFENPEKALVLILIPLVAFFWKQIAALFGRKPKSG